MSLKLFGGFAKGFSLQTPSSSSFRPTLTTLRRKFFDKYQDLAGYTFYDLCAGSGAVGLEALSYGAEKAIFVEKNPKHYNILKSNIEKFENTFSGEYETEKVKADSIKWITQRRELFLVESNIIFFDPPYESVDLYQSLIDLLKELGEELKAVVLIEADRQQSFEIKYLEDNLDIKKLFKQGTSFIAMI
jgi:16S rRNA (guanine966-N2)-methyltransferase